MDKSILFQFFHKALHFAEYIKNSVLVQCVAFVIRCYFLGIRGFDPPQIFSHIQDSSVTWYLDGELKDFYRVYFPGPKRVGGRSLLYNDLRWYHLSRSL